MSFKTVQEALPAGSYYIKLGKYFLSVAPDRTITTQTTEYSWTVSAEGQFNYFKDPVTTHYLTDNGAANVLSGDATVDGQWEGGSVDAYLPPPFY